MDINPSLHYPETCYQSLIRQLLERKGYFVRTEVVCPYVTGAGITFGYGRMDLLVELDDLCIVIELKANVSGRIKATNQLKRYLKHYSTEKVKTGLLVMFNAPHAVPILCLDVRS